MLVHYKQTPHEFRTIKQRICPWKGLGFKV
jgi:hypothetical protein